MPTRRRNGYWYMDRVFPVAGRLCLSLKTKDRRVASYREGVVERLVMGEKYDWIHLLASGRLDVAALAHAFEKGPDEVASLVRKLDDPKMDEIVASFVRAKAAEIKSASRYEASLNTFLAWAKRQRRGAAVRVSFVADPQTMGDFKQARLEAGQAPATVVRDMAALHQFLSWRNPELAAQAFVGVKWPTPNNRRTRSLSPDEIRRLLTVAASGQSKRPYADFYVAMLVTGMRPSEACRLTAREIDLGIEAIALADSKTENGRRLIPLVGRGLDLFTEYRQNAVDLDEPVFGIREKALSDIFPKHVKRAGLKDVVLRDLRRTHLQACRHSTDDVVRVRDQAGHSTVVHTEKYLGDAMLDERRDMAGAAVTLLGL